MTTNLDPELGEKFVRHFLAARAEKKAYRRSLRGLTGRLLVFLGIVGFMSLMALHRLAHPIAFATEHPFMFGAWALVTAALAFACDGIDE